jgi:hypothetical protein
MYYTHIYPINHVAYRFKNSTFTPSLPMKKLTIVGEKSPAKAIIRASLDLSFEIIDLLPDELNINNIGTTDLVIYVTKLVDEQTFERLRIV